MSLFFFNDTATTEIYTLPLHDALPISPGRGRSSGRASASPSPTSPSCPGAPPASSKTSSARRRHRPSPTRPGPAEVRQSQRSEEHTSELQSRQYLVCRLLLEKKNTNT